MAKDAPVTVTGTEDVPTEILATAIVRISEAAGKLLSTGLNRRALLVLLKDASGVPMHEIGKVLDALPQLAATYTRGKATKKR